MMPRTIKQEVIDSVTAMRTQPGITGPDKNLMIASYLEDMRQKRELYDD